MKFWGLVEKTETCWLWKGYRRTDGYGGYGPHLVHRYAYEFARGPIPQGLCVCHSCDVKNCVNPDHLFIGTYSDNMQDASKKGRMASGQRNGMNARPERRAMNERHGRRTKPDRTARGERNGRYTKPECSARGDRVNTAKITWKDAAKIRTLHAASVRTGLIAARYGLNPSTIRRIICGKYWKEEYAP